MVSVVELVGILHFRKVSKHRASEAPPGGGRKKHQGTGREKGGVKKMDPRNPFNGHIARIFQAPKRTVRVRTIVCEGWAGGTGVGGRRDRSALGITERERILEEGEKDAMQCRVGGVIHYDERSQTSASSGKALKAPN